MADNTGSSSSPSSEATARGSKISLIGGGTLLTMGFAILTEANQDDWKVPGWVYAFFFLGAFAMALLAAGMHAYDARRTSMLIELMLNKGYSVPQIIALLGAATKLPTFSASYAILPDDVLGVEVPQQNQKGGVHSIRERLDQRQAGG